MARFFELLGASWVGVDLFFVLSGFLLVGILLDHRSAPNLFRIFYWRRACRIIPAYFAVLAPLALISLAGLGDRFPSWREHLSTGDVPPWAYPLFVQNIVMTVRGTWGEAWIGPTWSLAVEEQFYLIVPLLIRFVPVRHLPTVLIGMVASAPLCRIALTFALPERNAAVGGYMLLPCRWDALLLGALAAWALRDSQASAWLKQHANRVRMTVIILLVAGLMLVLASPVGYSLPMRTVGYTLFAVLFAGVVLAGHLGVLPGHRRLEHPWLRAVGRVSYCLYLVHVPVSCLVFHLVVRAPRSMHSGLDVLLMAGSFMLALGLAAVSWRLFEHPILRFAHSHPYEPALLAVSRGSDGRK